VEICSRSGLLATDKCYDTVKGPNGENVQRRTTYVEIGTAAQLPTDACNVHGEPRMRVVKETTETEFPRAAAAVDLNEIQPVILKTAALMADKDPYSSARATVRATPTPEPSPAESAVPVERRSGEAAPPEPGAPVMKAIAVTPAPDRPIEIRKAEPVGPLDEVKEKTLLNSATPPPTQDPEDN
jgi:hypothetical protein